MCIYNKDNSIIYKAKCKNINGYESSLILKISKYKSLFKKELNNYL